MGSCLWFNQNTKKSTFTCLRYNGRTRTTIRSTIRSTTKSNRNKRNPNQNQKKDKKERKQNILNTVDAVPPAPTPTRSSAHYVDTMSPLPSFKQQSSHNNNEDESVQDVNDENVLRQSITNFDRGLTKYRRGRINDSTTVTKTTPKQQPSSSISDITSSIDTNNNNNNSNSNNSSNKKTTSSFNQNRTNRSMVRRTTEIPFCPVDLIYR